MRTNSSAPRKIQVRVSAIVDMTLDRLARRGLYGSNKSEVASYLLTRWVDDNLDKILEQINHPLLQSKEGGDL